jgi:hypothetical protein
LVVPDDAAAADEGPEDAAALALWVGSIQQAWTRLAKVSGVFRSIFPCWTRQRKAA